MKEEMVNFGALVGETLTKVDINQERDRITIKTTSGREFVMYHEQDCCESVQIDDVCGELDDIIGSPVLQAEESSNSETHPDGYKPDYPPESFTWTFYRLTTMKGQVVLRWLGESNGYYSEDVYFYELVKL